MRRITLLMLAAMVPSAAISQDGLSFDVKIEYPPIARYRELPMRMMSEIKVRMSVLNKVMDEGTVEFFRNIVETSEDSATQTQALEALADIARRELGNVGPALATIRAATKSEDRGMRRAAAIAIIEADDREGVRDLLNVVEQSNDDRLLMRVEPTLAEWKCKAAKKMWQARFADPLTSNTALALACDGLAAIGATDALPDIRKVFEKSPRFQSRLAAARSIGMLEAKLGLELGNSLLESRVADQIAAVALLSNEDPACQKKLVELCKAEPNAVAAAAWVALERRNAELLKPLFDDGIKHPDTQVRLATVRALRRFATVENCDRLAVALGDRHIVVRNNARIALQEFSITEDLKRRIVANADNAVGKADNWRRIEQSLLLAAILKQSQFAKKCVPLLRHERPEVFVTAAWLMHLHPNALLMDDVTTFSTQRLKTLRRAESDLQIDMGLQMASLFQLAGFVEHKPFIPLCEQQFNKSSGVGREGRAAAMWAIGMLSRDEPVERLVSKLIQRLNDRSSDFNPEFDMVRFKCVMSLGRMNARGQADQILNAYKVDTPVTFIPAASRWALEQLGQEVPPKREMKDSVTSVGGWKLSPVRDK